MTGPSGGNLSGKVIVVTGGASGIGRAAVERCAAQGAAVVFGDLASSDGAAVAGGLHARGLGVTFVPVDVTVEAECARLMGAATDAFGRLDVLIACAGILQGAFVDIADFDDEVFQHVLDVNVRGMFLSVKHAARAMSPRGGTILLIASGAGVIGGSSSYAYGTSKAAVHGLGRVLQANKDGTALRVNIVCPGNIATPLKIRNVEDAARARGLSAAQLAAARRGLADPDGVAKVLAFLASDDAAFVRGTIFTR
ncbi:MAG: SDR family oxidoreductase [Actinobacteria bacterium]|nr:SDR family oxidoreductase [Actinomycetota bacterium]